MSNNDAAGPSKRRKLLLLQYPAHRPHSRPYTASRSQKPRSLRFKPETGLLELDVPIDTHKHYNDEDGIRYQKALNETTGANEATSTFGLAAGFNTIQGGLGAGTLQDPVDLHAVPQHEDENRLEVQTLGGKISSPTSRDPIYMVGMFHGNTLHLTHLDAIAQMRPQLHHLDAQDELTQRRTLAASQSAKRPAKPPTAENGLPAKTPKLESKAVDVKLRDSKIDDKDRSLNANGRLLRAIQNEPWQTYSWTDQDDLAARATLEEIIHAPVAAETAPRLKSVLSNGEWLDKMSAPREAGHGKKGLLAKLRGREREKARRKKNEEERRRLKEAQNVAAGEAGAGAQATGSTALPRPTSLPFEQAESDSSELSSVLSSESEVDIGGEGGRGKGKEVEMINLVDSDKDDDVEIKEEPPAVSAAAPPAAVPSATESVDLTTSSSPARTAPTPKTRGRGRPRKGRVQVDGAVGIED